MALSVIFTFGVVGSMRVLLEGFLMTDGNPYYRAANGMIPGSPASYVWCVSWYVARVRVV